MGNGPHWICSPSTSLCKKSMLQNRVTPLEPSRGRYWPGAKQHIRLAHPQHWMHKQAAVARCRTLGLTYGSPCAYCSLQLRDPRAHVPRCSVVFQASLAGLVLCQDHDAAGRPDGGGTGEAVSSGVCRTLRRSASWDRPSQMRSHGHAFKPGFKGHSAGKGQDHGWNQWQQSQKWEEEGSLPDPSTRALLRTMTKLMLRHEAELARLRPSTTWMAFMDTQEEGVLATLQRTAVKWQEKFDAQQVDTSLKVFMFMALVKEASRRLEEMTQNEDQLARASRVGWLTEVPAVEPHHAHSGTCQTAGCHSSPRHAAAAGLPPGSGDGLQGAARSTGSTHRRGRTVYDLLKLAGKPGQSVSRGACGSGGKRLPEDVRGTAAPGPGPEVPDGQGPRAPISGPAVHGLDRSGGDLGTARALLEDGVEVGTSAGHVVLDCAITTHALPTARLQNRSNLCYLNSAAQALAWLGSLANYLPARSGVSYHIALRPCKTGQAPRKCFFRASCLLNCRRQCLHVGLPSSRCVA